MYQPACRNCGHPCDRVQWVVHDGEVVVANHWCSGCDEPGLVAHASFVDRRRAPLPSIAAASNDNNQGVFLRSSTSMVRTTMEGPDNASTKQGQFVHVGG